MSEPLPDYMLKHITPALQSALDGLENEQDSLRAAADWYTTPEATHSGPYIGGILTNIINLMDATDKTEFDAVGIKLDYPDIPQPTAVRFGICGRNSHDWRDIDYEVLVGAGFQAVKMMSNTSPEVFKQIKLMAPDMEIITRLYDGRFGQVGWRPEPGDFARRMAVHIRQIAEYCDTYQVHNEPNHTAGYEGWSPSLADAADFNKWFVEVHGRLKKEFPSFKFGFPGLAIVLGNAQQASDIEWFQACEEAAAVADFVGVHCYWQNPIEEARNHMSETWGLRYRQYRELTDKPLVILEAGNSNLQSGLNLNYSWYSREIDEWYAQIKADGYIQSVHPFILSSPDPKWSREFGWIDEQGLTHEMVHHVKEWTI